MIGECVGFLGLFSVCFCFGSLLFTTRVHLESFVIFIIFVFLLIKKKYSWSI